VLCRAPWQIPDAICHSYWYSYLMTQAWPGGLVTNVWLGVQLLCQISASNIQNRAYDHAIVPADADPSS
jgi:hypothetical protein